MVDMWCRRVRMLKSLWHRSLIFMRQIRPDTFLGPCFVHFLSCLPSPSLQDTVMRFLLVPAGGLSRGWTGVWRSRAARPSFRGGHRHSIFIKEIDYVSNLCSLNIINIKIIKSDLRPSKDSLNICQACSECCVC